MVTRDLEPPALLQLAELAAPDISEPGFSRTFLLVAADYSAFPVQMKKKAHVVAQWPRQTTMCF